MFDWITTAVEQMGYPGVALFMFLENVFPPIPSEIIMPLAGFIAERGGMRFWIAVLAGTGGSFVGAMGWYVVGRRIGEARLRGWVRRHGAWLTLGEDDIDRAQRWFENHGGLSVFLARLVPAIRTLISLPAGFSRMPRLSFALYTLAGTFLWTLALAWAGRLLGENYHAVKDVVGPVSSAIVGALVAWYAWRVVRQHRTRGERAT